MRSLRSFIPQMPKREFSERSIISDAELELLTHPPRNLTERGILAGSALVAENTRQGRNLDDSLFAKAVATKFGVDEVDVLTATGRILQTRDDLKTAHPELSALTISALAIENLRSEAVSDSLDFTAKTAPKIDLDFMAETRKDLDFTAATAAPTLAARADLSPEVAARVKEGAESLLEAARHSTSAAYAESAEERASERKTAAAYEKRAYEALAIVNSTIAADAYREVAKNSDFALDMDYRKGLPHDFEKRHAEAVIVDEQERAYAEGFSCCAEEPEPAEVTTTRGVAPATAADVAARQVASPTTTANHDVVNSWDINGPSVPGH